MRSLISTISHCAMPVKIGPGPSDRFFRDAMPLVANWVCFVIRHPRILRGVVSRASVGKPRLWIDVVSLAAAIKMEGPTAAGHFSPAT
jgi:hypothetical protein